MDKTHQKRKTVKIALSVFKKESYFFMFFHDHKL